MLGAVLICLGVIYFSDEEEILLTALGGALFGASFSQLIDSINRVDFFTETLDLLKRCLSLAFLH